MTDHARFEEILTSALHLARRPVAVTFREEPPLGVVKFVGAQPSGCSFWRLAANGRPFYTVPSDHYNCPVGSYTHNMALPPEREQELPRMFSMMADIGYIRMREVPGIARLPKTSAVAIYAALGETPVDPDVVIVAGKPGRLMLLQEAATRSALNTLPMLGRPTCAAIPAALGGGLASSLGCVGNRVYTGVDDEEFYTVIAGRDVATVVDHLETITIANAALGEYHRQRRTTIATA
jgi:uncharacterized protein (DUF169 family)